MAKDFLDDSNGDIAIVAGDLAIGFSDEQHMQDILVAQKGDYKQHPLVGVGIANYLKSPNSLVTRRTLEKEILVQSQADGATQIVAEYSTDGKLKAASRYE